VSGEIGRKSSLGPTQHFPLPTTISNGPTTHVCLFRKQRDVSCSKRIIVSSIIKL